MLTSGRGPRIGFETKREVIACPSRFAHVLVIMARVEPMTFGNFASNLTAAAVASLFGFVIGCVVYAVITKPSARREQFQSFGAGSKRTGLVVGGGIFLVVADTLARTLLGATEIPVGVVTALCGGPFFIYLLRKEGVRTLE